MKSFPDVVRRVTRDVPGARERQHSGTRPSAPSRRLLSLDAVTWTLLVISFLNVAGVTVATWYLFPGDVLKTAAASSARFALRHAADDSWRPMQLALEEARAGGTESIYQSLFFNQKVKFQYPPSSLLPLELIEWLSGRRADPQLLNSISWLCVLALSGLVPAIYLVVLKKFSPAVWSGFTRPDLVLQAVVLGLMTVTFYPVARGYELGQIQTWLTCLFAGAVLAWARGHETVSGTLIGLMVAIKPQLGVLLVWAVIQRRRRFLIGSVAVVLLLESLSLWRYGIRNHLDYLAVLSYLSAHGESFFANQSINGLLARALHVGNNLEWDARNFPPYNAVVYYGTLASSILMVALALFWGWKKDYEQATLVKFLMASLLVTMASPIAWEHHYGILAPIYAVLLALILKSYSRRKWLLWVGVSYFVSSNSFRFLNRAAETPWNFVQSYLFFGSALLILTVYLHDIYTTRTEAASLSSEPPGAR